MALAHLLQDSAGLEGLTAGGIALMVGCIGFVLGLTAFCFWRILRESNPSGHHHSPLDIDTGDTEDGP